MNYKITERDLPGRWEDGLIVGNGRMGAALMCGKSEETIYLNEETVWGSKEGGKANPKMKEKFDAVRKLFLEGKPAEGDKLAKATFGDCFTRICSYESAGKLLVSIHENDHVRNYKNELDLVNGLATVSYDKEGSHIERECFASYPDDVIVYRITSTKAPLKLYISYERELTLSTVAEGDEIKAVAETVSGDHKFSVRAKVVSDGTLTCEDGNILVTDTKDTVIYIKIETEFNHGDKFETVAKFPEKSFEEIRKDHIEDFSSIMKRADITLPVDKNSQKLTMSERRSRLGNNQPRDEELLVYLWQMARYMLISSSRKGTLPANLQGVWSAKLISPWSSDYHTNINLQENYWGAEVANLSDCHIPLFDYMNKFLLESGKETAKIGYKAEGCVVHHLSDIYGFTSPADGLWGIWPHGASWLAYHMWEHYLFTKDKEFLKNEAYEFIRQSSLFFLSTMIEDDKGRLIYGPSMSPENYYWAIDENGEKHKCTIAISCTMDNQIIDGLLKIFAEASEILGIDNEEVKNAIEARKKLPEQKIGKFGQIMEWLEDYEEFEVGHRHISPAFALYPGNTINRSTPELYKAVDVAIHRRITGTKSDGRPSDALDVGLTMAWFSALYARLRKGNDCYPIIRRLLSRVSKRFLYIYYGSANCFQIDANLGYLGAMSEMLIQSHEGVISLLPALPKNWEVGSFRGLKARGGFELSVKWDNYSVDEFTIISENGEDCIIELPETQEKMSFKDENGNVYTAENNLIKLTGFKQLTLK